MVRRIFRSEGARLPVTLDSITPKAGYLEALFSGTEEGPPHHYSEHLAQVLQACAEHQCQRVLLDHSRVKYSINVVLEHAMGVAIAEMVPINIKMVLVAPRSVPPHAPHLETVSINRGMPIRVFWDRSAAESWLLEQPIDE